MPNIGPLEVIVVLIIALVVFGPKRIPEMGRSVGRGMREFKQSLTGERDHDDDEEAPALAAAVAAPASKAQSVPSLEGEPPRAA